MMKNRKITALIICAVCLLTLIFSGYAPAADSLDLSNPEIIPIYRDGIRVSDGIKLGATTYTPLRAFSNAVGIDVDISWDPETCTAYVNGEGLELSATVGKQYMTANGRCLYIPVGVINYNGSVIVPIRELAKIFNVGIVWHSEIPSISLETGDVRIIESADTFYNADDLYWLSRLIYSESGNQPMDGKIGVGNVVLNRVADPTCPNTIYNVIFDNKYGVQFSVTTTGTIYHTPNEESVIAAKICLEGYNVVGNALYFVNPVIGASSWFANTRVFVATIGEHVFYA